MYIVLSLVFCVIVWLIPGFKKHFDRTAVYIICFSFSYVIIPILLRVYDNIYFSVFLTIAPVSFYIYGRILLDDLYRLRSEKLFIDLMMGILLCFSFFVFYYLFIKGDVRYGMIAEQRILVLSGEEDGMGSTTVGNYLCLCFSGLSLFIYLKTDLFRRLVFLYMFVLAIVATTYFLNRAGILISLVCFFLVSLYYSRRKSSLQVFLWVSILLVLTLYVLTIVGSDNIIAGYLLRNEDIGGTYSRFDLWKEGLSNLFVHPMGWTMYDHNYCHNMWLDIARKAGLLPFSFMMIITVRTLKNIISLFKKSYSNVSLVIISLYTCFILAMFEEPYLESAPVGFLLFFMLCGVLQRYTDYGYPVLTGSLINVSPKYK